MFEILIFKILDDLIYFIGIPMFSEHRVFAIVWILFCGFVVITLVSHPSYVYNITFSALMNDKTEIQQNTVLSETCALLNSDYVPISYNFMNTTCQYNSEDYNLFALKSKIFVGIKLSMAMLFTSLFVMLSIKFQALTKGLIAIVMALFLLASFTDVSVLRSNKTLYKFAYEPLFDVSGTLISEYSNSTFVDQFDFVRQLCDNQTVTYADFNKCEYQGIDFLQTKIVIMPLVVLLMMVFNIISVYRECGYKKRYQYVRLNSVV